MKKKALIFFTIGIGDSLMVTPVLEQLKDDEDIELDALVMSYPVKQIMENSGYFSKVHFIDFMKNGLFRNLSEVLAIRKLKYDISVLVFPSNHFKYHTVHFLLGAKHKYANEYVDKNFPDLSFLSGKLIKEDRSLHASEQNFRLFENAFDKKIEREHQMSIRLSGQNREFALEFITGNGLDNKTLIGIHAGSDVFKNMVRKRWQADKYSELLRSYKNEKNIFFLVFGGKGENELNESIVKRSPENSLAVKDTDFMQTCSLIEKCSAFVCGDTGLMHTASALKVPVAAIFGPTNDVYTAPVNKGSKVIKADLDCIPCFEYSRTPLQCSQNIRYRCLGDISVERVRNELEKIINNKGKE